MAKKKNKLKVQKPVKKKVKKKNEDSNWLFMSLMIFLMLAVLASIITTILYMEKDKFWESIIYSSLGMAAMLAFIVLCVRNEQLEFKSRFVEREYTPETRRR